MKQYIIMSMAVLAASTAVYAQDVNKTNAQGKREGVWVGYYPKTNYVKYEGTFKDGKETGTFKFYADEPEKKLIATKEFKADGSVYAIFFNGKKKMSEGLYVNKLREGLWKVYHIDGQHIDYQFGLSDELIVKGSEHYLRAYIAENVNDRFM